ncbi:hypothetical protein ACTFIV_002908 [Dictyostelium citrinum]
MNNNNGINEITDMIDVVNGGGTITTTTTTNTNNTVIVVPPTTTPVLVNHQNHQLIVNEINNVNNSVNSNNNHNNNNNNTNNNNNNNINDNNSAVGTPSGNSNNAYISNSSNSNGSSGSSGSSSSVNSVVKMSNGNSVNSSSNNSNYKPLIENTPTKGVWIVEIPTFSAYKESFYTPIFNLCESNWRLLIFPEGNNSPGNISIFLDYYDIGTNPMFQKEATLTLTLINQFDESKNVKKTSNHVFSFKGVNWGFISFLNLQILLNPNNGYLVSDKLKIKVEIQSPKTVDLSDPNDIKPYGKFSYHLTNFSHHFENFYSPTYYVCGSNWRIYIFPNGYSSPNYFSVYLDLLDVKFKPLMIKHLFFAIEIINRKNPEKNLKKWVDHVYDDKNMNFGFPKFVLLNTLLNPDSGFIVDDTIIINIEFTVMSSNFIEPSPNFEISSNLGQPDCGKFTFYAKKQPNIDLIFSPTFEIAGCLWQLVSYPLENLTDYFSIYLDLVDIKTKPLLRKHISFAIEIVNQDNPSKNFKKYISNIYSYNSFSWLFQKFMKISTLFKPENGFFKDGTIIINVELIVIASDFLRPIPFNKNLFPALTSNNNSSSSNNSKDNNHIGSTSSSAIQNPPTKRFLKNTITAINGDIDSEFIKSGGGEKKQKQDPLSSSGSIDNNNNNNNNNPDECTMLSISKDGMIEQQLSLGQSQDSMDIDTKEPIASNQLEEVTGSFSYNIERFSTLDKNFYSPVFKLYNTDWRFYIFPRGNSASGFFSLYLDYVDPKTKPKIRQYICFILEVVNKDSKKSEKKYSFHTFCYSSVNWGFKKFLPLDTIKKDDYGFLDNDTLTVKVTIYFLSQNILDTNHLLSYSNETSKHIQLYSKQQQQQQQKQQLINDVNTNNSTTSNNNSNNILDGANNDIINNTNNNDVNNEKLKKQKSDEENFYYHTIKLTLDYDFEKSQSFELVDFVKHNPIKIRKLSTLLELKLQIQMIYGVSFERQRIWFWDPTPTKASRVTRCPLLLDDEDIFSQYLNMHGQATEMRFHLEVSNLPNPNEKNLFFDPINNDLILVFFKYYDPYKKQLEFISTKVCQSNSPISCLIPFLNQKLCHKSDDPNSPLLLFGEDSNGVSALDPHKTLKSYEIANGSMIICQRSLSLRENVQFPYLSDYYNFTFHKVIIAFQIMNYKNTNSQTDLSFKMEVLKGMKYKEIIKRISEIIQTFPQNINLYSLPNGDTSGAFKIINPTILGEKAVYETLLSTQRNVSLVMVEVKETILPVNFLSSLDKTKVFHL